MFHVDETAHNRTTRSACHLHALSAEGLVDGQRCGVIFEAERQRRQLLRDGHGGVVTDGADHAAFAVERRERLQHVVQSRGGEIDSHALVAVHCTGVLKIAHAILVEHDLAHRQVDCIASGAGRSRPIRGWSFGGLGGQRERENQKQKSKKGTAHNSSWRAAALDR